MRIRVLCAMPYKRRGWPGHKDVYARLQRAIPSHDELRGLGRHMKLPRDIGTGAFRRHRRHRHERHRRDAAQSRLHGAGLATSPTAPTSSACASWASRSSSATTPRTSTAPPRWSSPPPSSATTPSSSPPAPSGLPLVRRAEMLAELMRLKSPSPSAARTARPPPPRWSPPCSTPAGSTRPWSTAASSTPTAPTPGSATATGWWWRPTRATAPSSGCRPTVAVVTNIDPEHLDHYGAFEAMQGRLPGLRREHPVLRLRRDVHRPSGGAGTGRADSKTAAWSPTA